MVIIADVVVVVAATIVKAISAAVTVVEVLGVAMASSSTPVPVLPVPFVGKGKLLPAEGSGGRRHGRHRGRHCGSCRRCRRDRCRGPRRGHHGRQGRRRGHGSVRFWIVFFIAKIGFVVYLVLFLVFISAALQLRSWCICSL